MAYEKRDIRGGAVPTTLASGVNSGDTSLSIGDATGWPSGGGNGDFFIVIDRGTATEEKIRCSGRSGTTVTVAAGGRGSDGTTAAAHLQGAEVEHCLTALDLSEANAHLSNQQADPHPQYPLATDVTSEISSALSEALGDYLPLAGGTLTGDVDFDGNEIQGAVVLAAVDKVYTATVSGAVTINANNGPNQHLTVNGNISGLAVSNFADGQRVHVLFQNDSSARTNAFNAAWLYPLGKTAATAAYSTAANALNSVVIERFGDDYLVWISGDLKT